MNASPNSSTAREVFAGFLAICALLAIFALGLVARFGPGGLPVTGGGGVGAYSGGDGERQGGDDDD